MMEGRKVEDRERRNCETRKKNDERKRETEEG